MPRPRNPGYTPGEHYALCDRCGFVFNQSHLKETWDGYLVCPEDWEPRQPQDFVRGREDNQAPQGNVNPEGADTYLTTTVFGTRTAIAGIAIAGIAVAGRSTTPHTESTIPSGTFDMSLD